MNIRYRENEIHLLANEASKHRQLVKPNKNNQDASLELSD